METHQDPAPRRHSRKGLYSLLVVSGGFAVVEVLVHLFRLPGPAFWRILSAGFEAGTIGAMADWFAVSALFRPISIPVIRRHTNILVRNRDKLTAGIVDMVQNKWLSPAVLTEKLQTFSAARTLIDFFDNREFRARGLDAVRGLLLRFCGILDGEELAGFLDRVLKDQLKNLDIAQPLGSWMEKTVRAGGHHGIWDTLLVAIEKSVDSGNLRKYFAVALQKIAAAYSEKGIIKTIAVRTGEAFGAIDYSALAGEITREIGSLLENVKNNPGHPLCMKLDALLLEFSGRLARNEREAAATVNRMRDLFVENMAAREMIRQALGRFRETVTEQLSVPESDLMNLIERFLDNLMAGFRNDPATQGKLDRWAREMVVEFVEKYHGVIGDTVASSLAKLSDQDLVAQVQEKVWDDLQYIRLNGAVVGGVIGVLLTVLKMMLEAARS